MPSCTIAYRSSEVPLGLTDETTLVRCCYATLLLRVWKTLWAFLVETHLQRFGPLRHTVWRTTQRGYTAHGFGAKFLVDAPNAHSNTPMHPVQN